MSDIRTLEETEAAVALARMVQASGYDFVTPTPASHAVVLDRRESGWARDLRDVFGWSLPFRAGVVAPGMVEAMRAAGVLARDGEGCRSLVRLSSLGGMLFMHSAFPTVQADAVFFGPDTYRFGRAIQALPRGVVRRAVDIGCGAGPGAVLVARAYPGAEVLGVDINERALAMTRVNARLAGVEVAAVRSDLLSGVAGDFDLVVANPPYLVDAGERAYRHGGGPLGAGLSLAIIEASLGRLAPGGRLLLYTGAAMVEGRDPFREAAAAMLGGVRWTYEEIDPDVFGEELAGGVYAACERIAAVALTVTQAG